MHLATPQRSAAAQDVASAARTIHLIRDMAARGRRWGAERIRGELRKLGRHPVEAGRGRWQAKAVEWTRALVGARPSSARWGESPPRAPVRRHSRFDLTARRAAIILAPAGVVVLTLPEGIALENRTMSGARLLKDRLLSLFSGPVLEKPTPIHDGSRGDTPKDGDGDGEGAFLFQSELGRSMRKSDIRFLMSRLVPMLPDSVLKRLTRSGSQGFSREDVDAIFGFQREVEQLPTVQNGMRALGMKSLMEWHIDRDRIMRTRSPYTHPMMRPLFFSPGLTARMRYDTADFDWVPRLEAAYPIIKKELLQILENNQGFQPYVPAAKQGDERWLVKTGNGVVFSNDRNSPSMWNVMYLYMGGPVLENHALCPRTVEILESIPRFNRRSPNVFSALHPGAHLAPHHGPRNGVLRVHLPLLAPKQCYLNVGSELFEWQDGKVEIFDDAFTHQAWNLSDRTRIVLHFDIYHPDWTDEEVKRLDELDRRFDGTSIMSIFHEVRHKTKDFLNGKEWLVR